MYCSKRNHYWLLVCRQLCHLMFVLTPSDCTRHCFCGICSTNSSYTRENSELSKIRTTTANHRNISIGADSKSSTNTNKSMRNTFFEASYKFVRVYCSSRVESHVSASSPRTYLLGGFQQLVESSSSKPSVHLSSSDESHPRVQMHLAVWLGSSGCARMWGAG